MTLKAKALAPLLLALTATLAIVAMVVLVDADNQTHNLDMLTLF
ncbi:MAG: hypothetical protein AAF234_07930 [Pseudomonadota bacterium]